MAEAIIHVALEKLAEFLTKQAKEKLNLLPGGVEREARNLLSTLEMAKAVLDDAERRMIKNESVKVWLRDLQDLSYDIDDVLDRWNYMILKQEIRRTANNGAWQRVCRHPLKLFSCIPFKQVIVRRDMALRIKELNQRLDLVDKRKNQFSFITNNGINDSCSQEWRRVHSTSFIDASEVFGRKPTMDNLVSQLLCGSCQEEKSATQILSIVGTGGIGKTTLAQLVYNDDQVKAHFERKAWVCVSDPFDEIRVAKAVVQSLESSFPNVDELDPLLNKVRDSILGKRTLFVFDDVWAEELTKWEPFKNVLKYGAPGSTILLTTRSERVARVIGALIIRLDVLSNSDSWLLFRQIAFPGRIEGECGRLEDIGREIMNKCKGLPLAIKTIGSLLRFKDTVEEWQKVMDSNTWELEVAEFDVFPHLYLSYNDLPSQVRRCFLYCAVLPKDKTIYIEELIRIWAAQGYFNSCGNEDDMEVKGREVFVNLAMRSLFQDLAKDYYGEILSCKMHDIVHDFAQFLSVGECLVIEGTRIHKVSENVRHLTWLCNKESMDTLSQCNMGQPRSFFASQLILRTLHPYVLNSLTLVRVLKLTGCGLKELPVDIGNLIHLRYLHLSESELRGLPRTLYDLYNLETLNLLGCFNLLQLPLGIEKLKNLRHLNYRNKIPKGIGKLTCLQTLNWFSIGRGFNEFGYLKNLNQLCGEVKIEIKADLDGAEDTIECENADLKHKERLRRLHFWFNKSRVKQDVMEALEPPPNLRHLIFFNYGEIKVPTWITSLNNLTYLALDTCYAFRSLPPLGMLHSLEFLRVSCLHELVFVDCSFFGNTTWASPVVAFPKLKELMFELCNEWVKWEDIGVPEHEDDAIQMMPCLRQLILNHCPKLKALPQRLLHKASSLECIQIDAMKYNPSTILSTALTLAELQARQSDEAARKVEDIREHINASCGSME